MAITDAVIATATTDGKPVVSLAIAAIVGKRIVGARNRAATITRAYRRSFSTTHEAIRSTSLSFNC